MQDVSHVGEFVKPAVDVSREARFAEPTKNREPFTQSKTTRPGARRAPICHLAKPTSDASLLCRFSG